MRIDRVTIQNFRKFEELTLELHPQFNLLVGNNGSGKTTILDALAVSLDEWFARLSSMHQIQSDRRSIQPHDIRLVSEKVGERIQFRELLPVEVRTVGHIGDDNESSEWEQSYPELVERTQFPYFSMHRYLMGDASGEPVYCPVLAFYGVSRAAIPDTQKTHPLNIPPSARRWDAYTHCLDGLVNYHGLRDWFYRERAARDEDGHNRPGYEAVRRAVFGCLPGADDLRFDVDRADLVCSIGGAAQPLSRACRIIQKAIGCPFELLSPLFFCLHFLHRFLRSALRLACGVVLLDYIPQQRIQIGRHHHPLASRFLRSHAAFLSS
jgi:predicted ATP-binding protein involved in virulence